MPEVEIAVRYCGGCNPSYDRVNAVKKLQRLLPEFSFVDAQPGKPYAAALIVSGCATACTLTTDLAVPADRRFRIGGFADLLPVRDLLLTLPAQEEISTMDRAQIESVLPHRPPMLFVDAVTRLIPGREATAQLYLDPQWELFRGHFPDKPVFPGVLIVEAMVQTSALMVMTQRSCAGKIPLLIGTERVRFIRSLQPGMTVQMYASLKEERRDADIHVCRCQAMAGEKLCAETVVTLAMR